MSRWQRNGLIEMPNGPYCRLCGRELVDESDQWAGRCNNDENCARRVKEQKKLSQVGVAGDRCDAGNECGRLGCPHCQD
jgi:hypothetical protein